MAVQEKVALEFGGYFSPFYKGTAAGSFEKVSIAPSSGLLKARFKPSSYFRELRPTVETK
jgi:hypothetical protein